MGAEGQHAPEYRRRPKPAPVTPPSPSVNDCSFNATFGGAAGSAPDPAQWGYNLGGGGWGNNEKETYTDSAQNARVDGDGNLAITVTRNGSGYDSARLVTSDTFVQMYGYFEASIWLSPVEGLWPAFWLLGVNSQSWPACGELDIMENYGSSLVSCTINNGTVGWTPALEADTQNDGNWHTYACLWKPGSVSMFKDGALLQTQTPATIDGDWPYDSAQAMGGGLYFILNVAVGGTGTNNVTPPASALPAAPMSVGYVRAWPLSSV